MAPMQKTYSYSPTSEAESDEDGFDEFERNLPQFLQRSVDEHVSSSSLPADSPDESRGVLALVEERDAALLREALGSGSTEVVHESLQCLTDMEVDSLGVATAVYLPPNAHILNPSQVLPPLEALQERRIEQLNEWLDNNSPSDPRYAEASKERWNEFRPRHPLFTEEDGANLLRWHKKLST